jgi:hypothetical protein
MRGNCFTHPWSKLCWGDASNTKYNGTCPLEKSSEVTKAKSKRGKAKGIVKLAGPKSKGAS